MWRALLISSWVQTALAQPAVLAVDSTPTGAHVVLGATVLGRTPLEVTLPPGTYELRVGASGFATAHHPLSLDAGVPKRWNPTLTPTVPTLPAGAPGWLLTGCRGVLSCGIGASDHPSPALAETLALARALAEAVEADHGRVVPRAPDAVDAVAVRVRTETKRRVSRVERWMDAEAGWAFVSVLPGLPTPVTEVGAADPRRDPRAHEALARLAALARALRWWFALRDGAEVRVESAIYDPAPVGPMFKREIEIRFGGTLGVAGKDVVLATRLQDSQTVRRTIGDGRALDEDSLDLVDVQVRQHGVRHVVRVRNGVATIETQGDPARVLADLERVIHDARIQTAYAPDLTFAGVPVARAILR